jgi:two-component system, NtrC family, sensor histidine kinase HydH
MPKTPPPPGFVEIQREELSRLFGRVTLVRLAVVPVMVAVMAWLLVHPVTPWRRNVLVTLGLAAAVLFVHEVLRHRRRGLGRRAFAVNFAFASVGQAVAALATGGLESPFFFAMFPMALVSAAVVESPLVFLLVGVQAVEVWLMAWVQIASWLPHLNPSWFGGDRVPGWNDAHVLWSAGFATVGLGVVAFLGRGIRNSFQGMVRRGLEAREEALRAHQDRAHELAALSGEIAHELKNPLASIKGLSALLAQEAPAGKPAERLQVLRREVDRMQGILDEFLNFSRPLVPLSVETVDTWALLREVVQMHEGMAHERNLRLSLQSSPEAIRCDPRKIKQAVINLVQNAMEASASGGAVEIAAEQGEDTRIRVLDRGPGIEPALVDKVFEPGVTSKPRGSGLGLTIARALARQHGGDLALSCREGGGTIAEIRLPKDTS